MCNCIFISHSHIVDIRNSTNKFFTFLSKSLSVALKTSQKKSCSNIAFAIGRRDSVDCKKKRSQKAKMFILLLTRALTTAPELVEMPKSFDVHEDDDEMLLLA